MKMWKLEVRKSLKKKINDVINNADINCKNTEFLVQKFWNDFG